MKSVLSLFAKISGVTSVYVMSWRGCSVDSSNVRMMRWLPQASLLAHAKTRLFVSHCGLNAVFEAAHYGVPVLAIPLSVDQHNHAAKVSSSYHSWKKLLC